MHGYCFYLYFDCFMYKVTLHNTMIDYINLFNYSIIILYGLIITTRKKGNNDIFKYKK